MFSILYFHQQFMNDPVDACWSLFPYVWNLKSSMELYMELYIYSLHPPSPNSGPSRRKERFRCSLLVILGVQSFETTYIVSFLGKVQV